MGFFSVFSVPQWQKRYTLQGDFTTAYILNQYQAFMEKLF